MVDEAWWKRNINIAYRQFCKHCQIINGRVRKGVSKYLSDASLRDFRFRNMTSALALSKLVACNEETGEEINIAIDQFKLLGIELDEQLWDLR